jgi:hypothetical protein
LQLAVHWVKRGPRHADHLALRDDFELAAQEVANETSIDLNSPSPRHCEEAEGRRSNLCGDGDRFGVLCTPRNDNEATP